MKGDCTHNPSHIPADIQDVNKSTDVHRVNKAGWSKWYSINEVNITGGSNDDNEI